MNRDSKIFVAGVNGLVGSAIFRKLTADGYKNILAPTKAQLDLTKQYEVSSFFKMERPE